jgi:hypothetical protein
MWKDPDLILLSYPLCGGGTIDFGFAARCSGMTAGTAPMMGRITGSEHYPKYWFRIERQYGLMKLKSLFRGHQENFVPDWLRADCYEGAYKKLLLEKEENDKARQSGSP